jgi:hypothetical protein
LEAERRMPLQLQTRIPSKYFPSRPSLCLCVNSLALAISLQEQENERFQPPRAHPTSTQTPSETPDTRRKKISENLKKGTDCSVM